MVDTPWMNKKAAAAYIGVSENTLSRYVRAGRIVKHFPDGLQKPMFRREQLDALMIPQPVSKSA